MSLCNTYTAVASTKFKIRCIAMYHNLIFVGCSDNVLRIYAPFQMSTNTQSIEYQVIKEERLSIKCKCLSQLCIIEYIDLLIIIVDETCTFYAISCPRALGQAFMDPSKVFFSVSKLFDFENGRGTVLCAVSRAWNKGLKKRLFIAMAKKRSITLYEWKGALASDLKNAHSGKVLIRMQTYPIAEKPKLLLFSGKAFIVGFREQYDLLLFDGSKKTLFNTGRSKRALAIRIIDHEILLVQDKRGIFVDYHGEPTRKSCIEWTDVPIDITFFYPYVIAVLPKSIDFHHIHTFQCIHKIEHRNGRMSASTSYKEQRLWRSNVAIATSTDILAINPCLISDQLKHFLNIHLYEEALKLSIYYEDEQFVQEGLDAKRKNREINELHGYYLYNNKQFMDAVLKFQYACFFFFY